jgi:hypothetical protein
VTRDRLDLGPVGGAASDLHRSVAMADSYVLAITEAPGVLTFEMDIALETAQHPAAGELRRVHGTLSFDGARAIHWIDRGPVRRFGAQQDLGSIHYLLETGTGWRLGGDWGEVGIESALPPRVTITR